MLNKFLQGNNWEGTSASNTDGILPGDTHASAIEVNRAIFHEVNIFLTRNR
jgi:hypothetical protein